MTIAFTICSNNYLSQAKTLQESLKTTDPDIQFYVGLVDRFSNIPPQLQADFASLNIIETTEIDIANFEWMNENYDIIELNTAVKPFYFQYFLKVAEKVIYFDPDIYCFQSVAPIVNDLENYNIILTPHLTQPIEDDPKLFYVHEKEILNHGIYNLGFVAVNNSSESHGFINWWAERLKDQCLHDLCNGLFVDQLWCNLVPAYFKNVKIEGHLGMNMAYWNLQERKLIKIDEQYWVNNTTPLIFYHFSNYNNSIPNNIATKQNRYNLETRPDLVPLYEFYTQKVETNHFSTLKPIICEFGRKPAKIKRYKRVRRLASLPFRKLTWFIEEVL